jgi:heme exporter protein A
MMFTGENLRCVRGARAVFEGLGFALAPGAALVLTGPNGSGKSSLLRLMAGLSRPDAGSLSWQGASIAADPEAHHARLHYLGHLDAVKPALGVRENLALWAGLRGAGDAAIDGALERFGLAALARLPARLLSAGQRRRLALARLLAAPAALWLLDEPTVALDRESVATLLREVAEHRASGGLCVVSTNVELAIPEAATLDLPRFAATADEGWGLVA